MKFVNVEDWNYILWTDSQTVLSWVTTPARKFKPFVSARVAEIQESVNVGNFKYVKSKDNPADALSRGIAISELYEWMDGPQLWSSPDVIDDPSKDIAVNDHKEHTEIKCELKESEETSEMCNVVKFVENELFRQLLNVFNVFQTTKNTGLCSPIYSNIAKQS